MNSKDASGIYVLRGSTKTTFCMSTHREYIQEVDIGNRLECSNLLVQLMSLECMRVCKCVCVYV